MDGFTETTEECVEQLNTHTGLVKNAFNSLLNSSENLESSMLFLLRAIKIRGILTMFGLRKTTGSQEAPWPSLTELMDGFQQPHTLLDPNEKPATKKKPSILTVGARALTKH